MKKCKICGLEKEFTEFYSHSKSKDGLLNKCKNCAKIKDYLNDKKIYTSYYPLKKDHPLYDNDNPNKKYPQEMVEQSKLVSLQINLWCNTERQRYIINQKILELLNKAFNYHYSTCDNYNKNSKDCGTLKRECLSIASSLLKRVR